ncbi:hypothetical protein M407DRAFT_246702 [Tulasnella calospora MUT 4182]|uniref:ZZ-type domain-containing protein n=1 Tax=Tulasnella calospora MUT 4182 TaxID=1051891 RepID=A0A0C3Q494_9AGAM|nr:hypothetical protein M407DRAFT_246762 [Tulasnella calospora MUT 4182]KIO17604.1 hypothetical protein M407DRAFT_246702 [Tulasnella calospora MUT 4182]
MNHLPTSTVYLPGATDLCCDGPLCGGTTPITSLAFHCVACASTGYDLCARCADTERGTHMHDLWTNIEPHRFVVFDVRAPDLPQIPTRS